MISAASSIDTIYVNYEELWNTFHLQQSFTYYFVSQSYVSQSKHSQMHRLKNWRQRLGLRGLQAHSRYIIYN